MSEPLFSDPRLKLKTFVLILLFAAGVHAQEAPDGEETKPKFRFITTEKTAQFTRPRVAVQKEKAIEKKETSGEVRLRPVDRALEKRAFALINKIRNEEGLNELEWSDRLADLARDHSNNMARHRFFSHFGLNGRTIDERAWDFGVRKWKAIGENIAYNKGFEHPADFAVERWMLSDGHRRNLLDARWKQSGIGLGITEDGTYYFTQIFLLKD